jgi:hypothetical protein
MQVAELNDLYRDARGDEETSATLAFAAAVTGKSINEINGLYDSAATGDSEADAILTFASVSAKQSMVTLNSVFMDMSAHDSGPYGKEANATLVYAAVKKGKSIDQMARLYDLIEDRVSTDDEEDIATLVLAAIAGNKTIDQVAGCGWRTVRCHAQQALEKGWN